MNFPRVLAGVLAMGIAASSFAGQMAKPPVAPRKSFTQQWHRKSFSDPYNWLKEKGTPEVERYLNDENRYTLEQTQGLKPFEETLYQEMLSRIKQDDTSALQRDGGYYYYRRLEQGKQYPIFCRKKAAPDGSLSPAAKEEILLDQNALGQGQAFISLSDMKVSDDGSLLLYTLDLAGFRQYDLYLKNLATGQTSGPLVQRVTSFVWASGNRHFFYTTEDATTKRSDTLWKHKIGGNAPQRILIEDDALFAISLNKTKDRAFIMLAAVSTDTWETKLLRADQPNGVFTPVLSRKKGHKYDVEHRNGWLYIRTNNAAKNFRLVKTLLAKPGIENWEPLIAPRDDVLLDALEVYQDFIAVQEKEAGLNRIRIQSIGESDWTHLPFPDPIYSAFITGSPEFDSKTLRYQYQSLVLPLSVYDYDTTTKTTTLVKRTEVPGGYDASQYASERLWATARDGEKIPLSVVYKKGLVKNGKAPLWLYAYGSYGYGISPTFKSSDVSLLDRGVIFAIAHVRGGNELGERWHDDGMLMKKKNTFFDYIDSAEFFIRENWTQKERILAQGGSAGGLLVGAVINMRPDLFGAAHASVPFVDVMNTMMDASLPLTVGEYLEWGNPNEKKAFDYMLSYSPYDNLTRKAYPPILVTTSYNDSQVMYWEPAKYVAKLRTLKTDKKPLHLKIKMEPAGHGGASGRFNRLRDTAFEFAWMLKQVGIEK